MLAARWPSPSRPLAGLLPQECFATCLAFFHGTPLGVDLLKDSALGGLAYQKSDVLSFAPGPIAARAKLLSKALSARQEQKQNWLAVLWATTKEAQDDPPPHVYGFPFCKLSDEADNFFEFLLPAHRGLRTPLKQSSLV
jgi:hypothetical protein